MVTNLGIDLAGQKFNRLQVLDRAPNRGGEWCWNCQCDCGATIVVRSRCLRAGRTKSCGCLHVELTGMLRRTHGLSTDIAYASWRGMNRRCYREAEQFYASYGGRGITVCDRWRNDFTAFLADMGPRPSRKHSIDRIDVNGDYEPGNCRWATVREQANNRTDNRFVEYAGRRQTLMQWAREVGIKWPTLQRRLKDGWSVERTLTTPIDPKYYHSAASPVQRDASAPSGASGTAGRGSPATAGAIPERRPSSCANSPAEV